jgi:hypothetical protein
MARARPHRIDPEVSHVTPTGRWAVEVFKGAPDGKLVTQYFEPAQWRPVYRILRHHRG